MPALPLAALLSIIQEGLVRSAERTSTEAALRLRLSDAQLRIPVYVRLVEERACASHRPTRRLVLSFPSGRQTPAPRSLGGLAITLTPRDPPKASAGEGAES